MAKIRTMASAFTAVLYILYGLLYVLSGAWYIQPRIGPFVVRFFTHRTESVTVRLTHEAEMAKRHFLGRSGYRKITTRSRQGQHLP